MKGSVQTTLVVFLVVFTALCLVQCFAAQETVTIRTYYPVPYGVYRDVNVTRNLYMNGASSDGTWNHSIIFDFLNSDPDYSSIKLVNLTATRSELRLEVWSSSEDRIYIGGAKGFGNLAGGISPGGLIVTAVGNAVFSGVVREHGNDNEFGCLKMSYGRDSGVTYCPANSALYTTLSPGASSGGGYFFCCNYTAPF